jgi:hypothetical protein
MAGQRRRPRCAITVVDSSVAAMSTWWRHGAVEGPRPGPPVRTYRPTAPQSTARHPVAPIGPEVRKATAVSPPKPRRVHSPDRRRQLAEATVATQFETIAAAAQGCDIIVAATALRVRGRWPTGADFGTAAADNRELGSGCRTLQRLVRERAQLPSGVNGLAPVSVARPHLHRRPGSPPTTGALASRGGQAVFQASA